MPDSVDLRVCECVQALCLSHRKVEIALIVRANIQLFASLFCSVSLVENVLEYVCVFMLFSLLCGKKTQRLLNMKS